ncbi:MAG: acyl-ACP--UDP-N-acetylglucosamine O-acyltransferase [Alloprevotella sp.]|nr:acyl-ACP--UDP-N-acetylglucosamine O-acyltransferase [Alloprevotella sp.]
MNPERISPLAYIHPSAVLGKDVEVHPFAYIDRDTVIGDGCIIHAYASILPGATLGRNNHVYQHAVIGATPQSFRWQGGQATHVRIGDDNSIRENVVIAGGLEEDAATTIGHRNYLMDGVHICHDVHIGDDAVLGIGSQVAGDCEIQSHAILSSGVILQHCARVGQFSLIQSGCVVQKDVPPYIILGGTPASYHGVSATILQKFGMQERILRHISNAYRIVYSGNEALEDALQKITEQIPGSEEIDNIVDFIRNSKRGIVRRTE